MNREERCEALAAIREAETVRLAERIADGSIGSVTVIAPPTVGMVMARAVDGAEGEVFNLGEVLATEARVSLGGHEGWGMVLGRCPEHALAVAIVDAGLEAGHPAGPSIERELHDLGAAAAAEASREWLRIAPTRVRFDAL